MKENKNILDELNKGCSMGLDAIKFILPKVEDNKFKELLEKQKEQYDIISEKIKEKYDNYTEKEPHETNTITKVMTWYGIEMKTMMDTSNSKIAELLLQGTNMGIIEGKKLLNNKEIPKDIKKLVKEYINMQEKCVEKLKEFL